MASTNSTASPLARCFRRFCTVLALGLVVAPAALAPAAPAHGAAVAARGYGWPVEPFFRQHPVRGFFGDPRIGLTPKGITHTFHFGIDIACPNGTPVYATIDGTVELESFRPETVSVRHSDGRRELQYWHVVPAVKGGQRVVAYRTVIGHVNTPWAHVHLAEQRDGRYVNPLRSGALQPFEDTTRPVVRELRLERDGRILTAGVGDGTVDLVVEAYDTTPLPVPAPWTGKPLTPALLRWRLIGPSGSGATAWKTVVDVRRAIPSDDLYDAVFARWTRQNKAARVGRYRFYLAHGLETAGLAPGRYRVQVEASDIRGNVRCASFALALGAAL